MPAAPESLRNPPIEYAVAVWVGMPDEEIARGLREGWIRGPAQHPVTGEATQGIADGAQAVTVPRARVEALVRTLDGSLDASMFDAAWNGAGTSDAARATRMTSFLARTLGVSTSDAAEGGFAALERAAANASGNARFVPLDGRTGAELEAMARDDAGIRVALAAKERWAFAGDRALASLADPHGRYDRFDRDTGEALLSDAWLGDRARHAAWLGASDDAPRTVQGTGWRFVDRADDSASIEIAGSDGKARHQVVFARDGGDRVDGGATTDRIHGGDGADVLRGRGGDDLLQGGRGSDLLLGGSGRDDLAGGQGDDDLDGGSGNDRLDGGSGADELAGGRGDDLLRGGAGADVYRFESGDGHDVIEDDGGAIVIDDVTLAGTMSRDGDGWTSADGALRFTLEGGFDGNGTLTITRTGQGAADAVRIAGWRQDAFGFALAGNGQAEGGDGIEDVGDIGPSPEERDARHTGHDVIGGEMPPSIDILGNEGSPGVAADDADAAVELGGIAMQPLGETSLVDFAAIAQALDGWNIPSPPDVDARASDPGLTVNETIVADALAADAVAGDDADADGGLVSLDWLANLQVPPLPDTGRLTQPALPVRSATA